MAAHLLAQEKTATTHFWYRLRARAVSRFVPRNATVLDVGAGAGFLGAVLRTTRPDVSYRYLEPDAELASFLRARFGETREHARGGRLKGPAAATLLDVIEHVDEPTEILRSTVSELPDGGVVIVTVPALRSLWSNWDVNLGHRRRYRRGELKNTLAAAGLTVTYSAYLFPELLPAALLRKVSRGDGGNSDFPPIPRLLNSALYAVGLASQRLGRLVPVGTSVLAVGVIRQ